MRYFEGRLDEGIRVRNNNILQSGFDDIIDYLRDKEEFMKDLGEAAEKGPEEGETKLLVSSFAFEKKDSGFALSVFIFVDEPDKIDSLGLYYIDFIPRMIELYIDITKLYPNEAEADEEYLENVRLTLEHESTHFMQDTAKSKRKYNEFNRHTYINYVPGEEDEGAKNSINYVLYALFNDIESEAYLSSALYKSGIRDFEMISESFAIGLSVIDDYAKLKGLSINLDGDSYTMKEIRNMIDSEFDEENLYGGKKRSPETIDEVIDFLCTKLAEHYNKEYDGSDKEKAYWVRLYVRESRRRFTTFMKKFNKLAKKYSKN